LAFDRHFIQSLCQFSCWRHHELLEMRTAFLFVSQCRLEYWSIRLTCRFLTRSLFVGIHRAPKARSLLFSWWVWFSDAIVCRNTVTNKNKLEI
jgi:hypothetical protein